MRNLFMLVATCLFAGACASDATQQKYDTNQKEQVIVWENIPSPYINRPVFRMKTPGGWVVGGPDALVYVPDSLHSWVIPTTTEK